MVRKIQFFSLGSITDENGDTDLQFATISESWGESMKEDNTILSIFFSIPELLNHLKNFDLSPEDLAIIAEVIQGQLPSDPARPPGIIGGIMAMIMTVMIKSEETEQEGEEEIEGTNILGKKLSWGKKGPPS